MRTPTAPGLMFTFPADQEIGSLFESIDSSTRSGGRSARPRIWSDGQTGFRASMQVLSGVAVVTLEGHLDPETVPLARIAVEAALRLRAPYLVLDLRGVQIDTPSHPALAQLSRITERHGVTLWLAGLTPSARSALRRDRTAGYRIFSTVEAARAAALPSQPDRRDRD